MEVGMIITDRGKGLQFEILADMERQLREYGLPEEHMNAMAAELVRQYVNGWNAAIAQMNDLRQGNFI
jgi:hypothetical protein